MLIKCIYAALAISPSLSMSITDTLEMMLDKQPATKAAKQGRI